jgi:putative phosphonate metabolism protein
VTRYALYYVPAPGTELARFGAGMLGYDPDSGRDVAFADRLPVERALWEVWTHEPRRYGFHATLKAPFRLRQGADEQQLLDAVAGFARRTRSPALPGLRVASIGGFVALVPEGPAPDVMEVAAACVRDVESLRAPLTAQDMARRLAAPLTEAQLGNLRDWGYPYVFGEFRFHMTLTGIIPQEQHPGILDWLAGEYARLRPLTKLEAVTVLRQLPGERFTVLARLPFQAP